MRMATTVPPPIGYIAALGRLARGVKIEFLLLFGLDFLPGAFLLSLQVLDQPELGADGILWKSSLDFFRKQCI